MHAMIWREGSHLKWDAQGEQDGRILDVYGQEVRSLENWTIFMDVICVISGITAIV